MCADRRIRMTGDRIILKCDILTVSGFLKWFFTDQCI